MNVTIGTCSRCGGRVSIPSNWMATTPAIPKCEGCGASKANPHGPVIDMDPPKYDQRNIKVIVPVGLGHLNPDTIER